jgi:sugar O-acyltransferase (sialic acid O-acetyltransferase NeuD family)
MQRNNKLVIIGNTSNARLANYFFENDTSYEVVAFSVNKAYIESELFEKLPVTPFEDILTSYPPDQYDVFVAVGYNNMNKIREDLYNRCKDMGYFLPNYISSKCSFLTKEAIGDNNLILEDNTIQPFVKIGSNNVLWSGNHVGHDTVIGDHNFITSHVVISGFVKIESHCFIGVNATLRDAITIASETLIAAGSIIMKNTEYQDVYAPARSVKLDKKSSEIKIS